MKGWKEYFSWFEIALWSLSVTLTVVFFVVFDRENYLTLVASIIGVTSLIFCAKGNPIGQALMIVFGLLYGVISFSFRYYGEMITYLGMTVPMAGVALYQWLKNPYKGKKSEVRVNKISKKEWLLLAVLSTVVTVAFYFILKAFDTANIIPSTVSITTSFVAVYLTARRSPYYAVAYALNDIVLVVLWILATIEAINYISVVVCFAVFLANDIYGFYRWIKMQKNQNCN